MKDLNKIVVESVNNGGRNYVREAVNRILGEDVKVGDTVAVIEDPISGWTGAKGRIKSISDANPGFAQVSLESGVEVPMQTSLLVPV